ncbi:MAG: hypothetical protein WCP45_04660 [Verrucomicrobiota bacterium]
MGKLISKRTGITPDKVRILLGGGRPGCLATRAAALLLLGLILTSAAHAQSAPSSNSNPPKPAPPPSVPGSVPVRDVGLPTSSRYAGKDLKTYVESLANQLAICNRATDPFCQPQDPNAKPVIKPTATKAIRRPTAEPPAPLSDIVNRIAITTVMPKDKRFLVGSRSITQNDKLPISFRNKLIRIEVTEVSARRIVFRNLDTGEVGIRPLDLLPSGMTPGNHNIAAPGMILTRPNAPLEVDLPLPSSNGITNP